MDKTRQYILGIETSTSICSVVLIKSSVVIDKQEIANQKHSEKTALFIKEILQRNDLTTKNLIAVAISEGPGSYTGLRIGASIAKGICLVEEIPLIPINQIQAMSMEYIDGNSTLIGSMYANKNENYLQIFYSDGKINTPLEAKALDKAFLLELSLLYTSCIIAGTGLEPILDINLPQNIKIKPCLFSATYFINCLHFETNFPNYSLKKLMDFELNYFKGPNVTKAKTLDI